MSMNSLKPFVVCRICGPISLAEIGISKLNAIAFIVFLVALAVRLTHLIYVDFAFDDSYIVWRIARNLAFGHGLVFNIGQYAQTSTSAIYALIMGLSWPLFGDHTPDFFRLLGVIADSVVALVLTKMLFRQGIYGNQLGVICGLLYAVFPTPVLVAGAGLETPFYCMFIVLSFYWLMLGRNQLAALTCALVAIIRPDGLLCFVIIIGSAYLNIVRNRNCFTVYRILVLPAMIVGLYYFLILAYYGSIVPQSIYAKSLYAVDHIQVWQDFLSKYFIGGKRFGFGLLCSLGVYAIFIGRHADIRPLLFWGVGYATAFCSLGVWWAWYYPPFIMVYSILLSFGVVVLSDLLRRRLRWQPDFMLLLLSVALVGLFAYKTAQDGKDNINVKLKYEQQRKEIAEYLNQRLHSQGLVTLEPLGMFGYFSIHRIADYPGLASRLATQALKSLGRPIGGNPEDTVAFAKLIDAISPDAVILRRSEYQASSSEQWMDLYRVEKLVMPDQQISAEHADFQPMYVLIRQASAPGQRAQEARGMN